MGWGLSWGRGKSLSWGEKVQGSLFSVDSSFIEIRNGFSKLKKIFYRFAKLSLTWVQFTGGSFRVYFVTWGVFSWVDFPIQGLNYFLTDFSLIWGFLEGLCHLGVQSIFSGVQFIFLGSNLFLQGSNFGFH